MSNPKNRTYTRQQVVDVLNLKTDADKRQWFLDNVPPTHEMMDGDAMANGFEPRFSGDVPLGRGWSGDNSLRAGPAPQYREDQHRQQVSMAVGCLHANLDALSMSRKALHERLECVMVPQPPSVGEKGSEPQPMLMCGLASELNALAGQINDELAAIGEILKRLQL